MDTLCVITSIAARYSRTLREYIRVAHVEHGECSICRQPIKPGEQYSGSVYVDQYGLHVSKVHYPDCPEDFYIRDKEEHERLDREYQTEASQERAA